MSCLIVGDAMSGGGFQGGDTHSAPPELIMHSSAEPLIFVSFEYRLGQFGFLGGCMSIPPSRMISSNCVYSLTRRFRDQEQRLAERWVAGSGVPLTCLVEPSHIKAHLRNQRAALSWVQRYIHLFGGDKTSVDCYTLYSLHTDQLILSKVTIWGESAGAGSTMFHVSPLVLPIIFLKL